MRGSLGFGAARREAARRGLEARRIGLFLALVGRVLTGILNPPLIQRMDDTGDFISFAASVKISVV